MRAAAIAVVAACGGAPAAKAPVAVENHVVAKPSPVAKCTATCLPDLKYVDTRGNTYTPESLAGKVVVVWFWATWCHPCQKMTPAVGTITGRYEKRGVVVLTILTDNPSDDELGNFANDYGGAFPVVRANSDLLAAYNYPQALPTTFIYDRSGTQVYSQVGPVGEDQLAAAIDPHLP